MQLQPMKNHRSKIQLNVHVWPSLPPISHQQPIANFSDSRGSQKETPKGEGKRSHPTSWSLMAEDIPAHACTVDGIALLFLLLCIPNEQYSGKHIVNFQSQPRITP